MIALTLHSLLRINISKLGCALTGLFHLRYSPHVASLLRINISKLGCALQAFFILRYSPHVASRPSGTLISALSGLIGFTRSYRLLFSLVHAIALTSLCSSGSISSKFSLRPSGLDRHLRAIEKEHTVHFA